MRQNIRTIEKPVIDVLIAVAARGGGENCINMVGRYLCKKGFIVRIIQMVYEGVEWADECMEFCFIYSSRKDHDLHDFISGYVDYIEHHGTPDLVLATAWPMMSYVARRTSQILKKNFIIASWLHAPLSMYEASNFGGGDYVKYADLHFAISDEIAEAIRNADPDGIIYRINNPVDLSKIHPVERRNKGTLLFVGRLSEEKNIGIIIGAIALAKTEWKLDIVGDGDEKEKLINLAKEFDVTNKVSFVGWADDPWKYAEGATALVLSSMYEGSPLVAIEALSCGLPIIANHSSRVGEVIIQNETGCLYEDNDIEGLAFILDDIANEKIIFASEKKCQESVFDYKDEIALFDFYAKIYATVNGRRVVSRESGAAKPIIKDRISVIVPCYNAEKYIGRCLDSIINQTVGLERLEIIAVNDCSTDHTMDILEKYEKEYPDSLCIVNCEENAGPGTARNIGLGYSTCEYVTFVDSDDCIEKDMLEKLLLLALCYQANVTSCDFDIFEDQLLTLNGPKNKSIDGHYTKVESEVDRRQLYADNLIFNSVWGKLFERNFIISDNDFLFPERCKMEDILFTYMVAAKADSWLHIKYKGYLYFQNSEGIMKSASKKEYYMDVFEVFAMVVDRYKELKLFSVLYRELEYAYYIKVFKNIIEFVSVEYEKPPIHNIRILVEYLRENFADYWENVYLTEAEKEDITDWCKLFIKVSIIVPCYNVEKLVKRCFSSLLEQTIGINQIEIIAINDCSTDGTLLILKEYEKEYSTVFCIVDMEKNAGQGYARNIGVQYANGDYICFVDSDDFVSKDMLEILVQADLKKPSDVTSCEISMFYDKEPENRDEVVKHEYFKVNTIRDRRILFARNAITTGVVGKIYRADFLKNHRDIIFPLDCKMEDIYYTYMVLAYASSWNYITGPKLYYYYQNCISTMHTANIKKYYMDIFYVFVLAMEKYKKIGLFEQLKNEIEFVYFIKVFKDTWYFMDNNFEDIPIDNALMLKNYILENFPNIENNTNMTEEDRTFLAEIMKE